MNSTVACIPAFLEKGVPVGWEEFRKNLRAFLERWAKLDAQMHALLVEHGYPLAKLPHQKEGTWLCGLWPPDHLGGREAATRLMDLLLSDPDNAWVVAWAVGHCSWSGVSVPEQVELLCLRMRSVWDMGFAPLALDSPQVPGASWLWGSSPENREVFAKGIEERVLLCSTNMVARGGCVRAPGTEWAVLVVDEGTYSQACMDVVLMVPELRDPLRWSDTSWTPINTPAGQT